MFICLKKGETISSLLKLEELLRNDPNISLEEVLRLFSFSDTEINYIESTTTKQWQCDDWYLHKVVVYKVKVALFFKRHDSALMRNENRVENGHRAWTGPNFAWKMGIARAWKGPPSRSGDEGSQDGARGPPPSRSGDECEGELYNWGLMHYA